MHITHLDWSFQGNVNHYQMPPELLKDLEKPDHLDFDRPENEQLVASCCVNREVQLYYMIQCSLMQLAVSRLQYIFSLSKCMKIDEKSNFADILIVSWYSRLYNCAMHSFSVNVF